MEEAPYNPLDKLHLGESVADAILRRVVQALPRIRPFVGAGIYAIYYTGDFAAYAAMAERNRPDRHVWPIYVGKAVPAGARKGGFGLGLSPGTVLFNRLKEHAKSIEQVDSLNLEDFACRYVVVDDIWIPLGESLLIERFAPLWNRALDGFGIHDPGGRRATQRRSAWDVVHPGRPWAEKLADNERSTEQLLEQVRAFLAEHASDFGG